MTKKKAKGKAKKQPKGDKPRPVILGRRYAEDPLNWHERNIVDALADMRDERRALVLDQLVTTLSVRRDIAALTAEGPQEHPG